MSGNVVRGLYTVVEAAQLVGVGRSTMYELVARGELSSVRLGRKVLITRATLEALLGFTPPTPAELADLRSTEPLGSIDRPARGSSTASECTPVEGVDGRARGARRASVAESDGMLRGPRNPRQLESEPRPLDSEECWGASEKRTIEADSTQFASMPFVVCRQATYRSDILVQIWSAIEAEWSCGIESRCTRPPV